MHRVNVLDCNGKEIEVTKVDDKTYTFIMPDDDVEITATFVDSGDSGNAGGNTSGGTSGGSSAGGSSYSGSTGGVVTKATSTGDHNYTPLWVAVAGAAAATAATVVVVRRKKNDA